jgi:phosphate transport system substrate-binding protein
MISGTALRNLIFFSCALTSVLVERANSAPAGSSTYVFAGATTVNALIKPLIADVSARHGSTIVVRANGAALGLNDLLEGRANVAMVGGPRQNLEKMLAGREELLGDLRFFKIAEVPIDIVLNSQNPVNHLTLNQVQLLLSGEITTWAPLGGGDLPVEVIVPGKNDASNWVMLKAIFTGGQFLSPDAVQLPTQPHVLHAVANSRGAIGFLTRPNVGPGVKAISVPSETRITYSLVTRGSPDDRLQAIIADFQESVKGQP